MQAPSHPAQALLASLVQARERLLTFVDPMRARHGVVVATATVTLGGSPFRIHRAGTVDEFDGVLSVSARVKHAAGAEMFWSVDVCWRDDGWWIQGIIELDRDGVITQLSSLQGRHAEDLSGCLDALNSAIRWLEAHGDLVGHLDA